MNQLVRESIFEAYCKEVDPDQNPFLSPVFLPNEVLINFPSTRINLAGLDPLHDDGYKLAYQLSCLNRDVKVVDYKMLPHGFLNFNLVPFIRGECNKAILDASKILSELFQKP